MKPLMLLSVLILLLTGCEKTVNFDLQEIEPRIVVEAVIENDEPPVVILSNSLSYFSEISPEILFNSFVHGAEIKISNGDKNHTLKEYSYKITSTNELFYYTIDSSSLATSFEGEFEKSYSLNVRVNGKEYTATTTIPGLTKTIDSLWWKKSPNNPDTAKVILMGRIKDPPGFGNYIRFFTRAGTGPFFPGLNSVFDDQIVDGTSYDIEIERGIDRNTKIDFDNYSFFNRGDTLTVKFTNIDKACFDFWRTMEYSYSSIGNPFSSPTKVTGNIRGGALGYFGGYAVQYKTLVIPR
jgi:hypothetical protein